jgi:hypothetical protein
MNILDQIEGFVIFDTNSGNFVTGSGSYPSFSKTPRIWDKLSSLKAHLRRNLQRPFNYHTRIYGPWGLGAYEERDCEVWDLSKNQFCFNANHFMREEVERKEIKDRENQGL